jgi:transposase
MFCGDAARRLATVPGIGPINATALSAAVGNASPHLVSFAGGQP